MSKKIIVVTGATGQQGGSVAHSLLEDGTFEVRAITRNKESDKAKQLRSKGAEIVECNINDLDSLSKACCGAYGVFAVTNVMDPDTMKLGHNGEFLQGKNMVDAAVAANITHFIFSSLDDTVKISNGKYSIGHFVNKYKAEEYAKTKNFKCTTFPITGFFLNNYLTFHKVDKIVKDGKTTYVYPGKVKPGVKIPLTDVEVDLGPIVLAALKNPEKYGKSTRIDVVRDFVTESELFERVTKLTGIPVSVSYIEPPASQQDEITNMFRFINEFGNAAAEKLDLSFTRKVYPGLKTIDDFIKDRNYSPANYCN